MTHLQELLLDLGKIGGALSLRENREALLHMLEQPQPGSDRVGGHLLNLHDLLSQLLQQARLIGPAMTDARIVEIRDEHLPSQGDSIDVIAFARAILRGSP